MQFISVRLFVQKKKGGGGNRKFAIHQIQSWQGDFLT